MLKKTSHLHLPRTHSAAPTCSAAVAATTVCEHVIRPWHETLSQPTARSQLLESLMLICHDTSPVLFSLPLYQSETLMHPQVPQNLHNRYPAQFLPLFAQICTNICLGQGTFPVVGAGAHLGETQGFRPCTPQGSKSTSTYYVPTPSMTALPILL